MADLFDPDMASFVDVDGLAIRIVRDDLLVPPANGDFLRDGLPRAVAEALDARHFVWEDAPEHYGALVRAWINDGYPRAGGDAC